MKFKHFKTREILTFLILFSAVIWIAIWVLDDERKKVATKDHRSQAISMLEYRSENEIIQFASFQEGKERDEPGFITRGTLGFDPKAVAKNKGMIKKLSILARPRVPVSI